MDLESAIEAIDSVISAKENINSSLQNISSSDFLVSLRKYSPCCFDIDMNNVLALHDSFFTDVGSLHDFAHTARPVPLTQTAKAYSRYKRMEQICSNMLKLGMSIESVLFLDMLMPSGLFSAPMHVRYGSAAVGGVLIAAGYSSARYLCRKTDEMSSRDVKDYSARSDYYMKIVNKAMARSPYL